MNKSKKEVQAHCPESDDDWDLIIKPRYGWLDIGLDELWRYRDLIGLFVRRDFVAQFKQTILGPAWFVIQPLITTIMFTIVFGNIAKISTDGLPKILFYLSGNILWQYYAQCLTATSDTFIANANIFGKVYFPRLVVPLSIIISQLLKLGLQFVFFCFFWLYYVIVLGAPVHLTWGVVLLPMLVLIMAALGLGTGIIVSSLTTKYRDFRFLIQFGVQLLMYTTTVIYPLTAIEGQWTRLFILANPMTPLIEAFRFAFLGTGSFQWHYLCYSFVATVLILFIGVLLFSRVERTFMDTV